ncbi:MAG: methyltransferase domain-containing protein [Candidatus Altiarchaeales archaeon]|nr:methyltransferase domain-containing protein [Candidatus Altiarchaeales archaeon]
MTVMDSRREERLQAHTVNLPPGYLPNPEQHLSNMRDGFHAIWTLKQLEDMQHATVLDIGCYDGWLDFLLILRGYILVGVEVVPELAEAARHYAERNFLPYEVHTGFFDELDIKSPFDVVMAYEVLEHVSFDEIPDYIARMERVAQKKVLISLPDQKHEENEQHLWTPTEELIKELWGDRKEFHLGYRTYEGTDIPPNFFISYMI